jgi:hypothetical protein
MPETEILGEDVFDGTLTDADVSSSNIDGLPSVPSLRTLGTGSQQAAAGDDPRFSLLTGSQPFFFDAFGPTGTVNIDSGAPVPLDTQRTIDTELFEHTPGSPVVSFKNDTGLILILAKVSTTHNSTNGGSRTDSEAFVQLDDGGGFFEISGSRGFIYNRNSSQGNGTITIPIIDSFASGNQIRIFAERDSGVGGMDLISEQCSLVIAKFGTPGVISGTISGSISGSIGGGDPNAEYVLLSATASLPNAKLLSGGLGINIPSGTAIIDLNVTGSGGVSVITGSGGELIFSGTQGFDEETHENLDTLVHEIAEDYFLEFIYDGIRTRVLTATYYTDNSKTTKIREFNYSYNGPRQKIDQQVSIQYDEVGVEKSRLTQDYSYSGFRLTSVSSSKTP